MKQRFNNPWTTAFMVAAAVITTTVLWSGDAGADEPSDEVPAADTPPADTVRFEQILSSADEHTPLSFRVYRPEDEGRRIWHVAVTAEDRPDDALCYSTFPLEAGRDFYDFQLHSTETDTEDHLALLEARPATGEGPLDPPVYQLAFRLAPEDRAQRWSCHLVGRGQHTDLDGGPRLALEEIDARSRLTRKDATQDLDFCGQRTDERENFELFDPDSGRFVPGLEVEVTDEGAEPLSIDLPDEAIAPPLTEGFFAWLSASSDLRGSPNAATVRRPRMLGSFDISTPWIEGSDELGIGEFVTANLNQAVALSGLRIFPGHGASAEAFDGYARPTRLLLSFSDELRYVIDLPEHSYESLAATGGLYAELPEPITTDCLSVMILDARPGDATGSNAEEIARSVAISEITPYSIVDAATESETATRIVDQIRVESSPRQRDDIAELGALIPGAMIDAIADVLSEADAEHRRRIVTLLGHIHHDKARSVLTDHFMEISPDDADYLRTKRALAAHGSQAAPVLLKLLDVLEPEEERKHVDIVRAIGRIGADIHRVRLVSALGEGSPFLRNERVRAIANGGLGVVPRLLSVAGAEGDTEAGLDALTALVFIGQRQFSDQPAEIPRAKQLQEIYHTSDSRAHRIRAIEALGYYYHPDADVLLGEQILRDDPDPVVRRFAALALLLYPGDRARQSLEEALDDRSPDVRIAAIQTLNRRDDANEATAAVIAYAGVERWPGGLRHALRLLARSSDSDAQMAITEIIREDVTDPVAGTALRALRRAERPLPLDQIEDLLAREDLPPRIVEQLIHMLGLVDTAEANDILMAIAEHQYEPLKEHTTISRDRIVARSYLALGTSRTEAAKQYLLDAVNDDRRSIEERSTALRGLGFFPDRGLLETLRELASQLPSELQDPLRRTRSTIHNRLAIEEADEEVDELIRRLDEELEQMDREHDDGDSTPQ